MNGPDFEISALLRAKRLVAHVFPDANVRGVGDVTLAHWNTRGRAESLERSGNVDVEKRVIGETASQEKVLNHEQQPQSGGEEDA